MAKRDTRQMLILAAERLFAERGIDGVSLREINVAAGQRNTSAAHYHFGSKDALVNAILEYRRAGIAHQCNELLDEVEASGNADDVRAVSAALILPLVAEMRRDEGASYYLMFLSQLFVRSPLEARDILRRVESDNRWVRTLAKALPELPPALLLTRAFLMGRHIVVSLASYQRMLREGVATTRHGSFDVYLGDMLESVAAYLSAPPSPEVLRGLEEALAAAGPRPELEETS